MLGRSGVLYLLPVVISALVTAGLAAFAWRRREDPGATAFAALMVAVTVWSGGYAAGLATHERWLRVVWLLVEWTAIPFVPVAWLTFALSYAGYGHLLSSRRVALLSVLPAATVALAWTNPCHRLVWETNRLVVAGGLALLEQTFGPWFTVNLAYGYVLTVVGTAVLFTPIVSDDPLYADQAIALVVGAVVPFVANLLSTLKLAPVAGLDMTPYSFAVTGLGFGLALFRYRLLDVLPALQRLGREVAISDLQDGVLVLDRDHRVRDFNPAAEALFGRSRSSALGEPVEAVVGIDPVDADGDRVRFPSPSGRLTLEASVSPVYDQHGRAIAYTLVVRDVTERETREQRLAVLNRVLRHNLRNDLGVVLGYAYLLADRVTPEDRPMLDAIEDQVDDLVELADRAREIEHLMAEGAVAGEPVDLAPLLEEVCDRVRTTYPECDIVVDAPAVTVSTNRPILEGVLANVVENAAEHNDAADPRIEVTAGFADAEHVEIRIADNGPGIPEQERVALDRILEGEFDHASGLGLWLVAWGVDRLGGDVAVDDNDPRGSVVTIRIPTERPTVPEELGRTSETML